MNEELKNKIESILSSSDIVWGRYGSDTISKLAERIIKAVEETKQKQTLDHVYHYQASETGLQQDKHQSEP